LRAFRPEGVPALLVLPGEPPIRGKPIDDVEPDIMARAVVFRPGIAQADNQANLRGRLLQSIEAKTNLFLRFLVLRRRARGTRTAFRLFLLLADDFRTRRGLRRGCDRLFFHCRSEDGERG
jgi:hypothetical protein